MIDHIEAEAARDILLALPCVYRTEQISLYSALGRTLSEDIYASFPVPPFPKSPFDGYALRSADCPGQLSVSGKVAAGAAAGAVAPGEAVRIYTGSPVPEGADLVVKQEDVELLDGKIFVGLNYAPDTNIIHAGEDYERGELLASAGRVLSPALLGVLASQGLSLLPVFSKPVVSLISTGSELREPGKVRDEYSIYNSSAAAIGAFLQSEGLDFRYLGIAPDESSEILQLSAQALESSDLVISTGGSSVGDYDYALSTAKALGAEILFWKVNMKPGGAILASVKNGKLLLNLSGNPAAAIMGLLLLAMPYIRKLCGKSQLLPERIRLPIKYPLPKESSVLRLLRGHIEVDCGRAVFAEHSGRGNGNISSFDNCDLIGLVPPGSGRLAAGDYIDAVRIL